MTCVRYWMGVILLGGRGVILASCLAIRSPVLPAQEVAWFWSSADRAEETQEGRDLTMQRNQMVEGQIANRGVRDPRVLKAMREVPRHRFVPDELLAEAYGDYPVPIGYGQTISQPYIVAYMCEQARIGPQDSVLEVGAGSGYHAAVISRVARKVRSIEIIPELYTRASRLLTELGYDKVETRSGDGYYGWPEAAPFDVIIVTAAADHIPPPLLEQLAEGGRMIIPVGDRFLVQKLVLAEKHGGKITTRDLLAVRFVPLTGER